MKSKGDIRKEILKLRNSLTAEEVSEKSELIMAKIEALPDFASSQTVFIYMDFKNEVRTIPLVKRLLQQNRRVIIPYTDIKNTVIIPVELRDMEKDLTVSPYGYLEPKSGLIVPVNPQEFDVIIVPGVAFDREFNRIGFGKGYYDRILNQKRPKVRAIAPAYELQVLDRIPAEPHDIKMNVIVTENRIYV